MGVAGGAVVRGVVDCGGDGVRWVRGGCQLKERGRFHSRTPSGVGGSCGDGCGAAARGWEESLGRLTGGAI